MIKQVEMRVGDTIKCIKGKPQSTNLYIQSECEVCGAKENIYYLVTDKIGNRIKLFGLSEWHSVTDFELTHQRYNNLPWPRKYYSQCGNWVMIGDFWAYRYSSNTYASSSRKKVLEGGLFIDPHSTEEIK